MQHSFVADHVVPDARWRRRQQDDRQLFERYRRDHDAATRDALVERFLPLARHLARGYDRGTGHGDDLSQVASLGLLKAIERYDPDRGIAFSSFAVPTISGEIKRHFRDKGWIVRVPRDLQERALAVQRTGEELESELGRVPTGAQLADRLGMTVEAVVEARMAAGAHFGVSLDRPSQNRDEDDRDLVDEVGVYDDGFEQAENAALVDRLLAVLDEREQFIVRLRFEQDLTQAEIARCVGISQMHVSRILRQAIAKVRADAEATSSRHASSG
jgi:RNA polymerase sigma-B factor